jgi:hypothetical protein
MIELFFFGIIGFAIGRTLTLIISQIFRQRIYLNMESARTMIILGSGGNFFQVYFIFAE